MPTDARLTTVADMESGRDEHGHNYEDLSMPSRAELVEQVMRMTDDDRVVLPYLKAGPTSSELLAATGRLLNSPVRPFPLSTPLAVWVGASGGCNPSWRELVANGDRSLWEELVFLRELFLYADRSSWCCPYRELEALRLVALETT